MDATAIRAQLDVRNSVWGDHWSVIQTDRQDLHRTVAMLVVSGGAVSVHIGARTYTEPGTTGFTRRMADIVPLLEAIRDQAVSQSGTIPLNLGDRGHMRGVAFCSNNPCDILIPDAVFLRHRGYASERARNGVEWQERRRVAFWRGGTSGIRTSSDWRTLPRRTLRDRSRAPADH